MSCIRFNTPAQREAMRRLAPEIAASQTKFSSPPVTESKIRRLRLLAADENPKIRESAASSYNTPIDLFGTLAHDESEGVRACVARNEATPCDVLRELAHDPSEMVRGWVAVNYFVPADAMAELADDASETVQALVRWKASLTDADDTADTTVAL